MQLPRLRQAVLVAHDLTAVTDELETRLGVHDPFRDPGVGHFGLANAVYAIGDTFLEVVSPVQPETAAGRQLERRGGNGGYMAMFQVDDATTMRKRLADAGVRIVWETTHDDIVDVHLHPKDVPGAIVALDVVDPPGSWRWGGPAWAAQVPVHDAGGLRRLTIGAADPERAAARWAEVIGVPTDGTDVVLSGGAQVVHFTAERDPARQGINVVTVALPGRSGSVDTGGVRFEFIEEEG